MGSATITSVVESQDDIPPAFLLPDATEAMVQQHPWLVPDWADADGNIGIRIQAFVVEIDGTTVLVDPCVGNHKARWLPMWNMLDTPWLDRLAEAGVVPAGIELVVHTHLHADHVGWDTHLDGDAWVPTFTNARHLYTEAELEHVKTFLLPGEDVYGDSIAPIFDAGLADVVEPDTDLGHGLRLEPTPGHTPGHTSLWVESDGEVRCSSATSCTRRSSSPSRTSRRSPTPTPTSHTRRGHACRELASRRAGARRALPRSPPAGRCRRRRIRSA